MDHRQLGLDESLIEAVKSVVEKKLHPNQEKLDKNKNGKLDAHDFKLLRKEEEDLDEAKATYTIKDSEGKLKYAGTDKDTAYKTHKSLNSKEAGHKLYKNGVPTLSEDLDEEQLDEAKSPSMTQAELMKKIKSGSHEAVTDIKPGRHVEVRHTGTGKSSMVYVEHDPVKEETELDEELSSGEKGKLAASIRKKYNTHKDNEKEHENKGMAADQRDEVGDGHNDDHFYTSQRHGNIANKLATKYKKIMSKGIDEETELDESGKVYDPITKKMVARKSAKVKMGGGATRNGVPVAGSTTPVKEEVELDESLTGLKYKAKKLIKRATSAPIDGPYVRATKARQASSAKANDSEVHFKAAMSAHDAGDKRVAANRISAARSTKKQSDRYDRAAKRYSRILRGGKPFQEEVELNQEQIAEIEALATKHGLGE